LSVEKVWRDFNVATPNRRLSHGVACRGFANAHPQFLHNKLLKPQTGNLLISIVMREDKLARLLFLVGCAGLPWLWAVHLMYWFGKQRRRALNEDEQETSSSQEGLLDSESIPHDEEPGDPAEVELEEKMWVRREFLGLVLAIMAWVTWIIVFQILKDYFPPGWLVRGQDDAELTGW
jgi:hypothetical protein